VELDPATIARLEEALSRSAGRPVEAQVVVDPTVIGGLVARIGDTVIDGSLRGRLESLRQSLEAQ
jgi:F-type H+-transporting ATPase subunit delta